MIAEIDLKVREVAIQRAIANAGMHRVVVGVDFQNEDPLKLRQDEAGALCRLDVTAFADVAEPSAALFLNALHHHADQPPRSTA